MNGEMISDFLGGAVQSGFAVAVAGYLLVRVESELKALRGAIERLAHCQTCVSSPFAVKPVTAKKD